MNKTQEFIDSIANDNSEQTSNAFAAMIMDKVKTTLDIKRVELASSTYAMQSDSDPDL